MSEVHVTAVTELPVRRMLQCACSGGFVRGRKVRHVEYWPTNPWYGPRAVCCTCGRARGSGEVYLGKSQARAKQAKGDWEEGRDPEEVLRIVRDEARQYIERQTQ